VQTFDVVFVASSISLPKRDSIVPMVRAPGKSLAAAEATVAKPAKAVAKATVAAKSIFCIVYSLFEMR
jgi:hypothetical protein